MIANEETTTPTAVDIGTLIVRTPNIRGGRPRIAGTGVTVQRIARDYKMGLGPDEIARNLPHLTLAQIYAAHAYYHANREAMDEEIARDDAAYEEGEKAYFEQKKREL